MKLTTEEVFWNKISGKGFNFAHLENHVHSLSICKDEGRLKDSVTNSTDFRFKIQPFYVGEINDNPLIATVRYRMRDKYISCDIELSNGKDFNLIFPTTNENTELYNKIKVITSL